MRALLCGLGLMLLGLTDASAQSCSFTVSGVAFGSVNLLRGTAVDTTATLSVSCTGLLLSTVRICPSLGPGSGGGSPAGARTLQGAGGTLAYQLYQDPGRTVPWGSNHDALVGGSPTIDLVLNGSGHGSTTRTLYGRILPGQGTTVPGTYTSTFAGADSTFVYFQIGLGGCDGIGLLPTLERPSFTVSATVSPTCEVAASDLDFGRKGLLAANVDVAGALSVKCTPGTAYSIGLNGGTTGAPPAARKMSKGAEAITYGLYKDAARTQPWGETAATAGGVSGSGTGLPQPHTIYGRVPPQPTPSPGVYTDTVVVTVGY